MADMTTVVTIDTVTALADDSGRYNVAAHADDGTSILLTTPTDALPAGARLQVDVTALPPEE